MMEITQFGLVTLQNQDYGSLHLMINSLIHLNLKELHQLHLTQDNDGKIWFTDTPNNKIGFLTPETEQIETISLPTEAIPISLQADFDNNIWVSLYDKNMLLKV